MKEKENKHNRATTLYYLLLQKLARNDERRKSVDFVQRIHFNRTPTGEENVKNEVIRKIEPPRRLNIEIQRVRKKVATPDEILKRITARVTDAIHRNHNDSTSENESFSFDKSSFYAERLRQHSIKTKDQESTIGDTNKSNDSEVTTTKLPSQKPAGEADYTRQG